jgi:hypothetical protein
LLPAILDKLNDVREGYFRLRIIIIFCSILHSFSFMCQIQLYWH